MAKTLQQLLGYTYLTGLVEEIKTGVPDLLPPAFSGGATKKGTIGDQGLYTRYAGTRQASRRTEYGAPSRRRELRPISQQAVKLIHSFEHIRLNVLDYQLLRRFDSWDHQKRGLEEVERQAALFRQLFDNLRISLTVSMLALGYIYFDVDGNLLATSGSATLTVDYGIGANNRNQLNGLIASTWATATNDITLHIRNLKLRARQDSGYPVKYAFYGKNIPSYLSQNNYVKEYLVRNPAMQESWLKDPEVPQGLLGLTWVPMHESFFEDSANSNQTWFGADTVVFAPEITPAVYQCLEGTYPVPTSYQPLNDVGQAMASHVDRQGMFMYALPASDPPTASLYAGDTLLPLWLVPDALYIADVTP